MADAANVLIRGVSIYDDDRRQLLTEQRFVPIEAFAYWLTHGDLRQVLAQHAPHLLAAEAGPAPLSDPVAARLSTGRILLIAAIIGASLTAGLFMAMRPDGEPVLAVRIFHALVATALAILAANHLAMAFRRLQHRRYGSGILLAVIGLMQALIAVAAVAALLPPG